MVITRTPFRVSFFGGGTDYPAWYMRNGGAVLATSIDKYCYLTVRYLPPFFEHRYRVVYSKNETCKDIADIQHPPVRAILQEMNFDRGLEIHHDGDLPARSGMGSSSSFAVGLLHAVRALRGECPSAHELALGAIHIEQEVLREAVGSQDQVMAAHGGLKLVRFQPGGEIAVEPVAVSAARAQELNDHLLLFYTGLARTSSQIVAGYINHLASKERQLVAYQQMVNDGLAILIDGRPMREFGELLHEAWQLKRNIGQGVTNDDIDSAYEIARKAGAWGGKLLGAGGGGFLLIFAEPSRHEAIKESLGDLLEIPFQFEHKGSQVIFVDQQIDYSHKDKARQNQNLRPFAEARIPGVDESR